MKLVTTIFATTALIALAGCNRTASNNNAANLNTTNAAAPAPTPAGNNAMPAGDATGGNGAKPSGATGGEAGGGEDTMPMEEEGSADANSSK